MTETNSERALEAFQVAKFEIEAMLERLRKASDEYFGCHPDAINFADVGTIEELARLLRQATDFLFGEGECAPPAREPP